MERELKRNEQEGMIGGVCAGLGEYLSIDKVWVRLIFVLSIFFSAVGIGIAGPIIYLVMWIVVPRKPLVFSDFQEAYGRSNTTSNKHFHVGGDEIFQQMKTRKNQERNTVGWILLFIGLFLLILQLDILNWNDLLKYWPVIFIVMGLLAIFRSFNFGKQPVYKEMDEATVEETSTENIPGQDEHHNQ